MSDILDWEVTCANTDCKPHATWRFNGRSAESDAMLHKGILEEKFRKEGLEDCFELRAYPVRQLPLPLYAVCTLAGQWLASIRAESAERAIAALIAEPGYGYYTPESLSATVQPDMTPEEFREMEDALREMGAIP